MGYPFATIAFGAPFTVLAPTANGAPYATRVIRDLPKMVCHNINPNENCHTGTQDIFESRTVNGVSRLRRRGFVNGDQHLYKYDSERSVFSYLFR